jgi:hypothetical protein
MEMTAKTTADWRKEWPHQEGMWWVCPPGHPVYLSIWTKERIEKRTDQPPPTVWFAPLRYPDPPNRVARGI